ncbi:nucleotidyl transferase AbiEii/AbiGii toxin family protein [Kiritimatiellaeota bacterium B1221]|nr:nucleotidyl transferase AbiEii/AbiGii toxin family protein [Kiritimatiellaeota bacterium B1221]
MKRVADLSAEQRSELFALTAESMGLGSAAVVEKDFWVCWTLKRLFEDKRLSPLFIFKGGTSLSKVFHLVERFSEDIDLILDWRVVTREDPAGSRSKTQQDRLNRQINEEAQRYISKELLPVLEEVLGDVLELEVSPDEKDFGHIVRVMYPETTGTGALLPYIQLEIGPLAAWVPHAVHSIQPYAAEVFPEQFRDPQCRVRAIDAERTFWEKATILHHEAHRPETSAVPSRYSRHYYDLFRMSQDSSLRERALKDLALLEDVLDFKKRFYPRGWAQYDFARPGTFRLIPPERVLEQMRIDYADMREMMFGELPAFEDILNGLTALESEING